MEEGNVQEESVKSKFLEVNVMKINRQKLHGFQKTSKQASRSSVSEVCFKKFETTQPVCVQLND
jgi:hypothetical protein